MAVGVLEVEATPAAAVVDLTVVMVVWPAAVGEPLGLYPAKDRLEVRFADMKGVVMTPGFRLVGEVKGQALVYLHLGEVALGPA